MGYKNTDSVLAKISDDEPIFVLRAQDESAPDIVRAWAKENQQRISIDKYSEAMAQASIMENWPKRKQAD